jgi:hypothetical protein
MEINKKHDGILNIYIQKLNYFYYTDKTTKIHTHVSMTQLNKIQLPI